MMQNRMTESEEQDAYVEHERYSPYLLADSEEVNDNEQEEVLEGEYVCNTCQCIPCMCSDTDENGEPYKEDYDEEI